MLEYEWGNPSTIMLSGEEPTQDPDQNRQFFDHYTLQPFNDNPVPQPTAAVFHQLPTTHQINSFYDPRACTGASSSYTPSYASLLSLDPLATAEPGPPYFLFPKTEEASGHSDFIARIGLNLGGKTYFSSAEDDFANRLYRRSRPVEPGSSNAPRCQAEGCNADLTQSKHYHRRHKVCEFHSKASTVVAAGLTQRFCQQCSRFHLLSEFDNGKRSCRRRLADHNRRRRKSHQATQESFHKAQPENGRNKSSSEITTGSPQDSGVISSLSPPPMPSDCFEQRPYQGASL